MPVFPPKTPCRKSQDDFHRLGSGFPCGPNTGVHVEPQGGEFTAVTAPEASHPALHGPGPRPFSFLTDTTRPRKNEYHVLTRTLGAGSGARIPRLRASFHCHCHTRRPMGEKGARI